MLCFNTINPYQQDQFPVYITILFSQKIKKLKSIQIYYKTSESQPNTFAFYITKTNFFKNALFWKTDH